MTSVSDRDGNLEIYLLNIDRTGLTRLTNNSTDDIDPAWSPTEQIFGGITVSKPPVRLSQSNRLKSRR